ncbi:MAG TPA: SDR family NAD(P)-dependent oxidoreductase [Thermoanaerobaculia bacterium]|nr:SDR family NAD(P)-dependent oxidoreductase [Thermoanaerobaculia bacterium]
MGILDGKVAIVTGGGNGIGRSHCHLFAELGARVLVNDPGGTRDGSGAGDAADRVVAELEKLGAEAVASKDPVGTFENAEKIVKTAVDAFGKVDILVNNAGILRDRTILKMSPEEWYGVLEVHLNGTFTCLQAAARQMVDQGTGGRIINTSSSSGLLGNFGQSNYGAAKAGIHALTRIAAWELAKHQITVNALAPNALTRMTEDLPGARDAYTEETMGPQFMSPIVTFLASDKGARITGQTFGADGNHLNVYKMMTSHGVTKRRDEPWTVDEIEAAIQRIVDW